MSAQGGRSRERRTELGFSTLEEPVFPEYPAPSTHLPYASLVSDFQSKSYFASQSLENQILLRTTFKGGAEQDSG